MFGSWPTHPSYVKTDVGIGTYLCHFGINND